MPAAHTAQLPVFGEGAWPALQSTPQPWLPVKVEEAPTELAGQRTHWDVPARPANCVAGQGEQAVLPGVVEIWPAGQAWHLDEPARENVPLGQI